jgi:hypothetical protein
MRNDNDKVTSATSAPLVHSPHITAVDDEIVREGVVTDVQTHEVGDGEDLEGSGGAGGVSRVVVAERMRVENKEKCQMKIY